MRKNKIEVTIQNSINSDGIWYPSISIYYSGCDRVPRCEGCHNKNLQELGSGFKTTTEDLIKTIEKNLIEWLDAYGIMAVCFLGGEPLTESNRESVLSISQYFKQKYGNQIYNIIYSWRDLEDLKKLDKYLKFIDYGVLGSFDINLVDTTYIPASPNQFIYDFKGNKKIERIQKG